jgi:hypothetical protein
VKGRAFLCADAPFCAFLGEGAEFRQRPNSAAADSPTRSAPPRSAPLCSACVETAEFLALKIQIKKYKNKKKIKKIAIFEPPSEKKMLLP